MTGKAKFGVIYLILLLELYKRLKQAGVFSLDFCTTITDNCSMECPTLHSFVQHVHHTAPQTINVDKAFMVVLNCYSSRRHPSYIEYYFRNLMDSVINATNASFIPRPSDHIIKKRFHELIREITKEFCEQGCFDSTRVYFTLAFAVHAWQTITLELVQTSFKVTGTFPFQKHFANKYKPFTDEQNESV